MYSVIKYVYHSAKAEVYREKSATISSALQAMHDLRETMRAQNELLLKQGAEIDSLRRQLREAGKSQQ